jgi:hypothetical protein
VPQLDYKRILIGLLVLVALASLMLGARVLFADRASPWRVVVPAVATVVLVAITGVYAWLTYQLVQQSDPHTRVRAEIEERAVADVASVLTTYTHRLKMMWDEYPLPIRDGSPPDMELLMERLNGTLPLANSIRANLKNLPTELFEDAAMLSAVLVDGEHRVLALLAASAIELAVARAEQREWTVDGAKSADYTPISKGQLRDWDDLVSGVIWELALRTAELLGARIEVRSAGRST